MNLCILTNEDLTRRLEELRTTERMQLAELGKTRRLIKEVDKEIDKRIDSLKAIKAIKPVDKACCGFDIAWVGNCKSTDLFENGQCEKHQNLCSCGKLATRECDHTGQFVCGRPLCDTCRCNH